MRKIINGLSYDTEKSTLVYREEDTRRELYVTKKGRWFKFYPNGVITPITDTEAMIYLGDHAPDLYEEYFGEVEEA